MKRVNKGNSQEAVGNKKKRTGRKASIEEQIAVAKEAGSNILWEDDRFCIKKSTIRAAGVGVFSKVRLGEGEIVGYYTGKMYTSRDAPLKSLYLVYVSKDLYIDGKGADAGFVSFIQHSGDKESQNASLRTSPRWGWARVETKRAIAPGEELFFNYGDEYWEELGIVPKPAPLRATTLKKK